MPWTIRISLAVLWGVCWMFYPADNERPNQDSAADQQYPIDWTQIQQSYENISQIGLRSAPTTYSTQPGMMQTAANPQFQQPVLRAHTSHRGASRSRDRSRSSQRDLASSPQFSGINIGTRNPVTSQPPLDLSYGAYDISHGSQPRHALTDASSWMPSGNVPDAALYPDIPRSFYPNQQQQQSGEYTYTIPRRVVPTSEADLAPHLSQQFRNLDMVENLAYSISPPVEGPPSGQALGTNAALKIENFPHYDEPSLDQSYPQTFKRDRIPPRNANDEIFCDHPECAGKDVTFSRICEWNKHLDKHERPYKCLERGCERLLGFTYSGGLLRHNREVHKKNLSSTKTPLFCPFPNCNRNATAGQGFTRQENLNEHKRRRHAGEELPASSVPSIAASPADSAGQKRKRTQGSTDEHEFDSEEMSDDADTSPSSKRSRPRSGEQSQAVIAQLRTDLRARDDMIGRQQDFIDSLKATIRTLRNQRAPSQQSSDRERP